MSQIRNVDIILEMMELAGELIGEVRQQLSYFRASVYKDETANFVRLKIEKLRIVMGLFPDDMMQEPFLDYDAELANAVADYIPGECSFTSRVSRLLESLDKQMISQRKVAAKRNSKQRDSNDIFVRKIRDQRSELMAICQHGSRKWTFFQRI